MTGEEENIGKLNLWAYINIHCKCKEWDYKPSIYDTIWIEHWDDFEYKFIPQSLSLRISTE